jgi:hypothetical protein
MAATQTQVTQTISYRGPPVLLGALAHLLGEEGLHFERPRDDRSSVAEVVEVTLSVRCDATVLDRTVDEMIGAAVGRFRGRFGDSPASVTVGASRLPEG